MTPIIADPITSVPASVDGRLIQEAFGMQSLDYFGPSGLNVIRLDEPKPAPPVELKKIVIHFALLCGLIALIFVVGGLL